MRSLNWLRFVTAARGRNWLCFVPADSRWPSCRRSTGEWVPPHRSSSRPSVAVADDPAGWVRSSTARRGIGFVSRRRRRAELALILAPEHSSYHGATGAVWASGLPTAPISLFFLGHRNAAGVPWVFMRAGRGPGRRGRRSSGTFRLRRRGAACLLDARRSSHSWRSSLSAIGHGRHPRNRRQNGPLRSRHPEPSRCGSGSRRSATHTGTPSTGYDAEAKQFWDRDHWDRVLRGWAAEGYTHVLYWVEPWNKHAWQTFLVRHREHPEARELTAEQSDRLIEHVAWIFRRAHELGLKNLLFSYFIVTTPAFAKAHGMDRELPVSADGRFPPQPQAHGPSLRRPQRGDARVHRGGRRRTVPDVRRSWTGCTARWARPCRASGAPGIARPSSRACAAPGATRSSSPRAGCSRWTTSSRTWRPRRCTPTRGSPCTATRRCSPTPSRTRPTPAGWRRPPIPRWSR